MRERFYDLMNEYLAHETTRIAAETEKRKRLALEDFAFFLDRRTGMVRQAHHPAAWKITDITEEDMRAYYRQLRKDKTPRIEQRVQAINHFMDYAASRGWIGERPWGRLYERRRGGEGHFRVSVAARRKVLEYLAGWKPREFFELRDRAVLLVLLGYKLRKTEISGLNRADYAGGKLSIKTPFAWRNREIELAPAQIEAIDNYLDERFRRNEAPDDPALFIGYKRKRIAPGMVKIVAEAYLAKITGEEP